MILPIILYIKLHKDIGLKSLNDLGQSDLGIKAIKVELNTAGIFPLFLETSTTLNRSLPIPQKEPYTLPQGSH